MAAPAVAAPGGGPVDQDPARLQRTACAHCNQQIGNSAALVAMGRLWHREHFICSSCNAPLADNYQSFEGRPFCIACHTTRVRPRCSNEGCERQLEGVVYVAMDRYWHEDCFRCMGCGQPLAGGQYYVVNDMAYDLACHWAKRLDMENQRDRL